MQSLTIRSDLVAGRGQCELTECDDRYVLRTPSQPDYWFGNTVIFKSYSDQPRGQVAQFKSDFPEARHMCLQWDVPNLGVEPGIATLRAQGFKLDVCDALVLDQDLVRFDLRPGLVVRQITGADWDQVIALQTQTGIEDDGYSAAEYPAYVAGRFAAHRAAMADGSGAWFGVFDGADLVADMGIYVGKGLARFQAVETAKPYRRQGICRALVGVAHDWAVSRDPQVRPVIIADTDGAPGRTYRACGFTLAETLVSAYLPGW